ncbi:MAG: HEAT repeat domain-containing protein [Deltaproteobacteria bacterium]|nr:HEAT repeat domain-containing protein [Deltaproteobacteria bacterium]
MRKIFCLSLVFLLAFVACNVDKQIEENVKKLKSTEVKERTRAAGKLMQLGAQAEGAVPALRETLQDPDWQVRNAVVYAIFRIGGEEANAALKEVLPVYIRALRSENPATRLFAIEGIGYFGPVGLKAVPEVLSVMETSGKLYDQLKTENPELAKYHYWISNQAKYTLQKLKGFTEKR